MNNYPAIAGTVLENLRKKQPRVHCLTNGVALNFTANMLLAIGALPSVTDDIREVAPFTASANALLVNLGQLSEAREQAILAAISAANKANIPWVLDPVFINRSPFRANFARELLAHEPILVRGNAAEWEALENNNSTSCSPPGGGLSSACETEGSILKKTPPPTPPARRGGFIKALSAPIDKITHENTTVYIHNGHPYMAKVTAMGCAGTALIAACIAAHDNSFVATIAGFIMLGVAGELAAQNTQGVGTFAPAFLDALSILTPEKLEKFAKVTQ